MLDQAFAEVYTKFKLHFYRKVFSRFQSREAGMTMFSCGSELSLLAAGLRNTVAHIKG